MHSQTILAVVPTFLASQAWKEIEPVSHEQTIKDPRMVAVWAGCDILREIGEEMEWAWLQWGFFDWVYLIGLGLILGESMAAVKAHFFPSTSIARAAKESVHLGDAQKSTVAVPSTTTEIPAPGSDESKSQGIDIERLADQHEPVNPTPVTSKGETNFEECKKIIAATENQLHLHAARARPNARLRVAFGINSCFTSEDENFCKNFRKGVEDKLYVPEADWEGIAKAARELAEREFAGSERKLKLFDAVQMVTMKMMLRILFARDAEDASLDNHIRKLAKEVNDQWVRSKAGLTLGETPSWSFDQQDALKDAADAIFGAWDSSDVDNPFNYILPGYETMWRAVLRGVVEMTSGRHEDGSVAWKAALSAFLDSPTRHQLQRVEIAKGLKVEHISLEILRLYPPTRRISRMHMNPDGSSRVIAADIEGMHHTADTWQPDPLVFRPERWILLDGMDTRDFLPFGNSPFNCPARRHKNDFPDVPFGVSMVAALTGSLVEAMGEKWYLHPGDFPPSEMQLHNNREDYSEVFVYRIEEETGEVAVKTDQNLGVKELQTNGTMPVVPDASASGREAGIDSEKVPEEEEGEAEEASKEIEFDAPLQEGEQAMIEGAPVHTRSGMAGGAETASRFEGGHERRADQDLAQ